MKISKLTFLCVFSKSVLLHFIFFNAYSKEILFVAYSCQCLLTSDIIFLINKKTLQYLK